MTIAAKCPVHLFLHNQVVFVEKLVEREISTRHAGHDN